MTRESDSEAKKQNLKSFFQRMLWVLLGGPASISLLSHIDEDSQFSQILRIIILNFEKVSRAFWDLLLAFLPFRVPLDRDLMSFAALLAIPLAFRKFILRKTQPPYSYDSLSAMIVVYNLSGFSVNLMVVTIAVSGQSIQTGPLFWTGLGCYMSTLLFSYLDSKAMSIRHHISPLSQVLKCSSYILGSLASLALFASQQNFDTATSLQLTLFWIGIFVYFTGGIYATFLLSRRGLASLEKAYIILPILFIPPLYISGMPPGLLSSFGYGWGLLNGLICAALVAFTFHNIKLLPEAPIYILLLSIGIIFIDWFSRTVAPPILDWLQQNAS